MARRFRQALLVEPVDPFQPRDFNVLEASPWSARMDHFGLEQKETGFGL
jgi:hypothetical protein